MNWNEFFTDHLTITPKVRLDDDCGVLTAADAKFFIGAQILYTSIVKPHRNVNFTLFDIGLTTEQQAWMERQPRARLVPFEPEKLLVPTKVANWQKFNRPHFLSLSPYQRSVWIDCDMVVKASLAPLFHHVKRQPFIVRNDICSPNNRRLHDYIPTKCTTEAFALSSCVFAWNSGRQLDLQLIQEWAETTRFITTHPDNLVQYLSACDEAILRVVVQKLDLVKYVWPDRHWNAMVYQRFHDIASALTNIRVRCPNDFILHYFGRPKIWESMKEDILDINPHENT